jgi:glycosyltransferase involved in cell wall biosynthesis
VRVAVLVHFYVPFRCAGSETMLHTMLKRLKQAGHEVLVAATVLPDAPYKYEYEGIPVVSTNLVIAQQELRAFKPDAIITHHDNTPQAIRMARKLRIPSVFLMHNDFDHTAKTLNFNPDMVVFNTRWLANKFDKYQGKSVVVHPPVWAEEHATTPGTKVTLVNLNEHKGANILYKLAERMPHVEFMGVVGGHGVQVIREDLPNVEIVQHTDDMVRDVWSKTRILLMPSVYESYGMAGVEALASGIPVLCNPTNGLVESQGPFGIFINRDDTEEWVRQIERLHDDKEWKAASSLALKRSQEIDPGPELDAWVDELERLVGCRN